MPLSPAALDLYLTLPNSLFIKNCVDNFTHARNIPLFLTYADVYRPTGDIETGDSAKRAHFWNRLPAWYVLK